MGSVKVCSTEKPEGLEVANISVVEFARGPLGLEIEARPVLGFWGLGLFVEF